MPSWQYINLIANLVELREIPCVKPSEEQAGRGFCDQCLREADAFAFEAERVLSATDPIVRSEGIRRSRTQILGRPSLLTFLAVQESKCRAALAPIPRRNRLSASNLQIAKSKNVFSAFDVCSTKPQSRSKLKARRMVFIKRDGAVRYAQCSLQY